MMSAAMGWMQQFSIRLRMHAAVAMVLALLLDVGAIGLMSLQRGDAIADAFAVGPHAQTVQLATLRTALGNVRRFEKDLLINDDSTA